MQMVFLISALNVILFGLVMEAIALSIWLRSRGQARAVRPLLLFLGSGILLISSLKSALIGSSPAVIGGILLAGGVVHVLFLIQAFQLLIPDR